jgi:prepilin peptidase CpaA
MELSEYLLQNWHIKAVSAILILAAWIDGRELKVPNWITFPMILAGLVYSTCVGGLGGLGKLKILHVVPIGDQIGKEIAQITQVASRQPV